MKTPKYDAAKEALREAFSAYQAATLGEHAARTNLSSLKAKPKTTTPAMHSEAHQALITAIGEKAALKIKLDEAIVARGGADR